MKFAPLRLEHARGKILGHNVGGDDGRRLLRKGTALQAADLEKLRAIGRERVYVAQLEPTDVGEVEASRRLGTAVCGSHVASRGGSRGRVDCVSEVSGLSRVHVAGLAELNGIEGVTCACVYNHTPVRSGQLVATVKIIPYALPGALIERAERLLSRDGSVLSVDPIPPTNVGLVFVGSLSSRASVAESFQPLVSRLNDLGARVSAQDYVTLEDEAGESSLSDTLRRQVGSGCQLICVAGETAIMDRHDMAPRAVERAGGRVECVGAPVDPGNLLMLAYVEDVPIVGAPGCARSPRSNVIDWVLPRLLVGDALSRADIIAMGHGGLLEDVPERGVPREPQH